MKDYIRASDERWGELRKLQDLQRTDDSSLTPEQRSRLAYLSMCETRAKRNGWGPLWTWMNFLLWKFDLEGLCGPDECPYDEYEAEVKEILPRLVQLHKENKLTRETVKVALKEVFDKMFIPGTKLERYDPMAGIIVNFFAGSPFMYSIKDCEEFL